VKAPDHRSYRVALVSDRYVNPRRGGFDVMAVLLECGWGAIQLPSEGYTKGTADLLLEQVAEQTEEFHRRGYDLVIIGRRAGLIRALKAAGIPAIDRIEPKGADDLKAFLVRRPAPTAAQHRPG
jgi:hypothetical protein